MKRRLTAVLVTLLVFSACDEDVSRPAVEAISRTQAEALFVHNCAICHGVKGDGRGARRRSLYSKPPDFRSASWRRDATLASVRNVVREGRPGTDMPAWKNFDEAQIAGLAEYVLDLSSGSASGSVPD